MPQQRSRRAKRARWDLEHPDNEDIHTWVFAGSYTFVVTALPPIETKPEFPAGEIIMTVNGKAGTAHIPLSQFREDELRAIAYAFNKAFELALPMVQAADQESNRRYEAGEEFQLRRYRSVPAVLSVAGYDKGDDESVSERPAPTALDYRGPVKRLHVRGSRNRMGYEEPDDLAPPNNEPQDRLDP
jgi:hypothetical protein